MNILLIHQNFPGQFKHLGPALVQRGHRVLTLTLRKGLGADFKGIEVVNYRLERSGASGVHPWVADFEAQTIRGDACFRAAMRLRDDGFVPDLIIAHPGWGESLFLKEVWPRAKLAIYCEFYYQLSGADVNFDPEFAREDPGVACRIRLKNLNNILHFQLADAGIAPTRWQASTFPEPFRSRIMIIHDGIDTKRIAPDPKVTMTLNTHAGEKMVLTQDNEVITFVNRNLEPTRGFHIFMRALPKILKNRPRARVLIVGGENKSYGASAPDGKSWKTVFTDEIRARISNQDWQRVHFVGMVSYQNFIPLLQLSTVHVYLTYPFVLSWSLIEAMSAGCAIVASDTAPVREAIRHNETGVLTDFFDVDGLSRAVCNLLDNPAQRDRLGKRARAYALTHYDLKTVCLPLQLAWLEGLV